MSKDKWINIRCSEEEREEVNEIAKRHKMSVAKLFWKFIEYLRKEDEGK